MKALQTRTLDTLPAGATASVLRVEGDDGLARRLRDLGFWPGTKVSVLRRALFGGPVAFFLQGYRLALRRGEAARVVVTTGSE